jgi:chromosome segregation ATPase
MEFEQIVKRLEWLDAEQRKAKTGIASMEERLTSVEATANAILKQLKEMNKELSQASASAVRVNQFNELLAKQREDFNKLLEGQEKAHQRSTSDAARQYQQELEAVNRQFAEFREVADAAAIRKELKVRGTEQARLSDMLIQMKPRFDEVMQTQEEVKSAQRLYEENRRQDVKRLTDLQGELTALRKRIDETRAKNEVNADGLRNAENRLSEMLASETERKTAQSDFLEQQALAQVERDRAFKEWRDRFDAFRKQATTFDSQVSSIGETLRAAQKAQETYGDLNTRLERRINEVSEMQRLTEDRLRQEWVTFKADDQKRWTGFALSQEESVRDIRKGLERMEERTTALDDLTRVMQDQLHQTTDTTEKQLHEMMNSIHEWMASYQRIMGHGKKPAKKSTR